MYAFRYVRQDERFVSLAITNDAYTEGATGNVATEDVIYLLNGLGIDSGVDLDNLAETGMWITQTIGKPNRSKVGVALAAR